tara:strand:+ start:352 stop:792 length:441 start_codon:yes stop_codon:yes gene_type:complete
MNYKLIKKNFTTGRIAEIAWLQRLSEKYPTIIDNNMINKYSHMDALSNENDEKIEHELKCRNINHNEYVGIMINQCKITYSVNQLKKGIRQIYYWKCKDGLYYWELKDLEKQRNELIYYRNGNIKTGEGKRDVVDIKTEYLRQYED